MGRGVRTIGVWWAWGALVLEAAGAQGAFLRDWPLEVRQCDGMPLMVLVTGDEFRRTVRDLSGQPLVRDPATGCITFGIPDSPDAVATHPALTRWALRGPMRPAPTLQGSVTNLAIFVRFEGDDEMIERIEDYEEGFNDTSPGSVSMRAFFQETSLGALDIRTVFLPPPDPDGWAVAYTDPHSRGYYGIHHPTANPSGYRDDEEAARREHALLEAALRAVEDQVPTDLELDRNGDGVVDSVIFLVEGPPGDPWAGLLWPHKWSFPSGIPFRGLVVDSYNMDFTALLLFSPGTFAHEMMHTLGAPDLYHYNHDGLTPVGPWDLMEQTLSPPQHPLAYLKWRYLGWIPEPPLVGHGDTVSLRPSWTLGTQAVQVMAGPDPRQVFWLEYRRAEGPFEASLPSSGLLVYRVDLSVAGDGNRNGPPDEVYVFRPGGRPHQRGQIALAPLGNATDRDRINEDTDPAPVLQDWTPVTLRIYDVTEDAQGVTFRVCLLAPDCGDRVCGDDGCGGSCGTCEAGFHCPEGACVPCSCDGRSCGDDGCGNPCGSCDDGNPCTEDRCEDGGCIHTPAPVGTTCDDEDPCTTDDACDGEGICKGSDRCTTEDLVVPETDRDEESPGDLAGPDLSLDQEDPSPDPSVPGAPEIGETDSAGRPSPSGRGCASGPVALPGLLPWGVLGLLGVLGRRSGRPRSP